MKGCREMKKILSIILVLVLTLSIAACSSNEEASDDSSEKTNKTDVVEDETDKKVKEEEVEVEEAKEPVTLRYLAWNLGTEEGNNLERQMLAEYEKLNPHVTIEVVSPAEGEVYDDMVSTFAAGGNLPDVFMWARVPEAVGNEWALDVMEYANNDPEWSNLPKDLMESITYDQSVYSVPYAIHLMGYFINKDIFNELNIDSPKFGFSWDEFEEAVKKTSVPSSKYMGLDVGAWERILEIYPAVKSDEYGWFAYDGEEFVLNSDIFKEGIEKTVEMYNNENTVAAVDAAEYFEGIDWPWGKGHVAMNYDGTWSFGWMPGNPDITWNFDFVGIPGGKVVIVPDFIFVARSTEHPEEAYNLAKFMGYSKEGYLKRIELAEADDALNVNSIPVVIDDEIMTILKDLYKPYPQFIKSIENMNEKGIVELYKTVPGYPNARNGAETGIVEKDAEGNEKNLTVGDIFWQASRGMRNYSDIADEINRLSNEEVKKAKDALK